MIPTAASLRKSLTLDSSDFQTLKFRFSSYLSPLNNSVSIKKKKARSSTVKTSLTFLNEVLKVIAGLVQQHPSLGTERAAAFLDVYRIVLDSLSQLYHRDTNYVKYMKYLNHRGALVCYLEKWEKYKEAKEEGVSTLRELQIDVSNRTYGQLNNLEPETACLVWEVVSSIVRSVYNSKSKDVDDYKLVFGLVELVSPKLRALDSKLTGEYHPKLVNILHHCLQFFAAEHVKFESHLFFAENISVDSDLSTLVTYFCRMILLECFQTSLMEHFLVISSNICKIFDKWWRKPYLILDLLRASLERTLCGCKAGVLKEVDKILEFVFYCAVNFPVSGIEFSKAVEVLCELGRIFVPVSRPVASIMFLYAAGLYFKCNFFYGHGLKELSLNTAPKELRSLSELVRDLIKHSIVFTDRNEVSRTDNACTRTKLHGNATFFSYLASINFLCENIVKYGDMIWSDSARKPLIVDMIVDVMVQFSEFVLTAFSCQKISPKEKERLQESKKTLLKAMVTIFKLSVVTTPPNYQVSGNLLNSAISKEWMEADDLEFLYKELDVVAESLHTMKHSKQACVAFKWCCKATWALVDLRHKGCSDEFVTEAFGKCARIVNFLHKHGSEDVKDYLVIKGSAYDIAAESLVSLSSAYNRFPDSTGPLVLVKQWVKMLCREYKDADAINKAPMLYYCLKQYCSKWSNKEFEKILEQEQLAYDEEALNPKLRRKLQLRVVKILLDEVFTTPEHNFQKYRTLVRQGRYHRAGGMDGLSDCLNSLRSAINLLNDILLNPSERNSSIYHQLAITHLLAAQCTQEASPNSLKEISEDIEKALEFWSKIDKGSNFSLNEISQQSIIALLCSIVDLLSMKGCLKLQISICKLIITYFKLEKTSDICLTMLWSGKRGSHSLCSFPIEKDVVLFMSEHLDANANKIEFWLSCFKGYPSGPLAFLQKFLLLDGVTPELSVCHGLEVTADEVNKAASSVISKSPHSNQDEEIAASLYYDLAERLFSNGHLFEALSYAKWAYGLRTSILEANFIGQKPYLEAIGSVITKAWPDHTKCSELKIPIMTVWSVLRCYLESLLQVGIINESIGNGKEAEIYLKRGKMISCLKGFPIFQIVFMTLLGQLYRKQQLYGDAKIELKNAQKIFKENEINISCKHCLSSLGAFIDMQFGDRYRYLPGGGKIQLAKIAYKSALRKLSHDVLEIPPSIDMKGVLTTDRIHSEHGAVECNICASSSLDDGRASSGLNNDRKSGTSSSAPGCSQSECEDTLLNKTICWKCVISNVMEGGHIQNIISFKLECHRRRLILRLLMKIAKCNYEAHNVPASFWQCISVMFYQKRLSKKYIKAHASDLFKLIVHDNSRDVFPLERAKLLYITSVFVLNHRRYNDEGSTRGSTRCFPNLQSDIVSWLLSAFIISRESPLLFQKVSQLLAWMLISKNRHKFIVSLPRSSLSIDHWAAYFHQASIGTYIPGQYLSWKDIFTSVDTKDPFIEKTNFLRLAPGKLDGLKKFVEDFFSCLPTVPIVCMSVIANEYIQFIGKKPPPGIPSPLAWMLISRLRASDSSDRPIVMHLPVKVIPEEVQSKKHETICQCPWGYYTIIESVAPSFKRIFQENNFGSSSSHATESWWMQESKLDCLLQNLLKSMEDMWFGHWSCLLLGGHLDPSDMSERVSKLMKGLKLLATFEATENMFKTILGGSMSSIDYAEKCISELLSSAGKKGNKIEPEKLRTLIEAAMGEVGETSSREPVIFVLDSDLQSLCFENLPILRSQEIYRMPSVSMTILTLKRSCFYYKQDKLATDFPCVDPSNTYYLLNPGGGGDFARQQNLFEDMFKNLQWKGIAGKAPESHDLVSALGHHDLFIYFGHGDGTQYIPADQITKLDNAPAILLMGCSSGSIVREGCYAPIAAPIFYLYAGSPAIIANLWDVSLWDGSCFTQTMLKIWLQETLVSPENCTHGNKGNEEKLKGPCEYCGRKRIASLMHKAREACSLAYLGGAAPVCYGVPTFILKKKRCGGVK